MVLAADCVSYAAVSCAIFMPTAKDLFANGLHPIWHTTVLGLCMLAFQFVFRTYDSLWRYAEAQEYILLFWVSLCAYGTYLLIFLILFNGGSYISFFMLTIAACSLLAQLTMRFSYRIFRKRKSKVPEAGSCQTDIAVIGAGNAGAMLFEEIRRNPSSSFKTWCFIDDDSEIIGRKLHGVKICGPIENIKEILKDSPVSEVILAIPSLNDRRKREIIDLCSDLPYRLKILPDSLISINSDNVSFTASLRDIRPEDLLGRSCVDIDGDDSKALIEGKVVLITGCGGSIGSELCRQCARLNPKKLVMLDVFENGVYILEKDLQDIYGDSLEMQVEIACVRDEKRLRVLFERHNPDIIFHAAAHKHVPLMEHSPGEAVKNNILPTYNLIKLAALFGCQKFVMISTDKAVNPTSVMGATKRYCEMMIQAMAEIPDCVTEFVAVRFGNVLGSSGSVVPLFINQIEHGGPLTITDKRIIRYFMTISEAVSLVLKAGAMANNSEIFVLNMGKPVKILTLAENLIKLAGFIPYKDIQIIETGLRPGEKLYEELLIKEDSVTATSNQKIFKERQKSRLSLSDIERGIKILGDAVKSENDDIILSVLQDLVPSFRTAEEVNTCVKSISEVPGVVSQSA
jgi:FlaA1/EpsC-like NDP-sugar epimerase